MLSRFEASFLAEAVLLLHLLWVRLGVVGLDSNAQPPRSADTAHRFAYRTRPANAGSSGQWMKPATPAEKHVRGKKLPLARH